MGIWHYARGTKIPTPGAMEYALLDNVVADKPWIGPAIGFLRQFRSFNPQNTQDTSQSVLTGVGGLAHGQSALQPLSNPYQNGSDAPSAYNWDDVNS